MNACDTFLKEVWECFVISKTSKCGLDAKALSNDTDCVPYAVALKFGGTK